jgi:hypothetical protein
MNSYLKTQSPLGVGNTGATPQTHDLFGDQGAQLPMSDTTRAGAADWHVPRMARVTSEVAIVG